MGCSSSKEDNVQEPEQEKKKKSKKDSKDKKEDKNKDKKDDSKNGEEDKKKKKKKKKKNEETIEDPPQNQSRIEEENQQAGAPAGGAGPNGSATYPDIALNAMDFAPVNDPKSLESTNDVFGLHQSLEQPVQPEKLTGPLASPTSTAHSLPQNGGRPQTSAEDEANLKEMQQMKANLDALQTKQAQQSAENAKLLEVLMKMDEDQKQSAAQHADALQKQKEDYEKILNGNQEEIKKLQLEQQQELQRFQEQQLANAQNQQKPTTAVSVRPQTFQTDPGTSVSQRQTASKTPMMPPGTAATTALMENATKEEIAARFIVMRQIAAQRKKENQKLRDQFLEVLAQQRNQPAIRPNTSASVIMAKRVNDQQVQRMEKIIGEQDLIISKLEHLLGRADVQPDNAFKSQIDELYQLTQQRQRLEQQALPMGYQTHAAGHGASNFPPASAARSIRSLPAPQPSKMEELFEKEQRKNEKLEQQLNLERREAEYNKQMAERELALVQNQLRLQHGNPGFAAPYPGAQAWGAGAQQGALPPVGYPAGGFPPRPY